MHNIPAFHKPTEAKQLIKHFWVVPDYHLSLPGTWVIILVSSVWEVNMDKADQVSSDLWWLMVERDVDRCSLGCVSILVLMVMLLKLFCFKF